MIKRLPIGCSLQQMRRFVRLATGRFMLTLIILALVTAHFSTALTANMVRADSPSPMPCQAQMVAGAQDVAPSATPVSEEHESDGGSCPMMKGAVCQNLLAVSAVPAAALPPLQIAGTEPSFSGPASHPYLVGPPTRPPQHA